MRVVERDRASPAEHRNAKIRYFINLSRVKYPIKHWARVPQHAGESDVNHTCRRDHRDRAMSDGRPSSSSAS
jgi:hypothetical protein